MKNFIKRVFFWIAMREDRNELKEYQFTIVSNNCFGGILYKQLRKEYLSPFVGLFITGRDYLKLVNRFDYYMEQDLLFSNTSKSDYVNGLKEMKPNLPIGKLDDVEVVFLHYFSNAEALEKWLRRKSRMNLDNMIFKHSTAFFSDESMINEFLSKLDDQKAFAIGTADTEREIKVPTDDPVVELYWPMFNYKMHELLKNGRKVRKPMYIRFLGRIALEFLK